MLNHNALIRDILLLFKYFGVVAYTLESSKGEWKLVNRVHIVAYTRAKYDTTLAEAVLYVDMVFNTVLMVDKDASMFFERRKPS